MTFQAALKRLPLCAAGNFDGLTHKTIADLRYIVRHELDMFLEGQETDIKTRKDERDCWRFLTEVRE